MAVHDDVVEMSLFCSRCNGPIDSWDLIANDLSLDEPQGGCLSMKVEVWVEEGAILCGDSLFCSECSRFAMRAPSAVVKEMELIKEQMKMMAKRYEWLKKGLENE